MTGRDDGRWAAPVYLDTTALVKLFVPEPESDALNRALVDAGAVILSDLALTEMASALGRRTREGLLEPVAARRLHRRAVKLSDSCKRAELVPEVHRHAERLLLTARDLSLRALDALHVALAVESGAATLVTYDARLRKAAASYGLFVAPDDQR